MSLISSNLSPWLCYFVLCRQQWKRGSKLHVSLHQRKQGCWGIASAFKQFRGKWQYWLYSSRKRNPSRFSSGWVNCSVLCATTVTSPDIYLLFYHLLFGTLWTLAFTDPNRCPEGVVITGVDSISQHETSFWSILSWRIPYKKAR